MQKLMSLKHTSTKSLSEEEQNDCDTWTLGSTVVMTEYQEAKGHHHPPHKEDLQSADVVNRLYCLRSLPMEKRRWACVWLSQYFAKPHNQSGYHVT